MVSISRLANRPAFVKPQSSLILGLISRIHAGDNPPYHSFNLYGVPTHRQTPFLQQWLRASGTIHQLPSNR